MGWTVEKRNGIYLPQIDWHLDARKPASNVFISHAHFDHMGDHASVLCSPRTARLIQSRLPGKRNWRTPEFQEPFELAPGVAGTLYPAGHIVGSSMIWLENNGSSLLYTGDFKLSPNLAAENCVVPKADTLIIETTYGIPKYTFPPVDEVSKDIVQFCKDTIGDDLTPVLFGYSLGKSQELLKSLEGHDFTILLHPQVFKMTKTCQEIGLTFPDFFEFQHEKLKGSVVISPPLGKDSSWLAKIPNRRVAMVSGWALDPAMTHRNQCDRAFPLSDHADFLELLDFVFQVDPRIVYTTHGYAKEFAEALTERGIPAFELGANNQLGLELGQRHQPSAAKEETSETSSKPRASNSISRLSSIWAAAEKTDSQARRVEMVSEYFASLEATDVALAALFLSGRAFPRSSPKRLNIDSKLNRQAILHAANKSDQDYQRARQKEPDTTGALLSLLSGSEPSDRTLPDLRALLDSVEKAANPVFRHSLLSNEYRRLAPSEAKPLHTLATGRSDLGIDESTIEKALSIRFEAPLKDVQQANLRCSDIDRVANAAMDRLLDYVPIELFFPLQLEEAIERTFDLETLSELEPPLWTEHWYDGLRCQIHKVEDRVELYDSIGNRITHRLPEITESAILIPQDYIADGTLVAWGKESPLPFSELNARLTRPAQDLFLGEDVDTLLWLHDLIWFNGETLMNHPLSHRKRELDRFSVNLKLRIAPIQRSDSIESLPVMLKDAQDKGHQGLIIKNATSPYDPLSQEFAPLALK